MDGVRLKTRSARGQDGRSITRSSERWDIVVVGAGIIGLASAMRLLEREPGTRLLVLEKEPVIAAHQTGHNSGVIHRGVYYAPGSLKAKLCVEGAARLIDFCDRHRIPYRLCGKLVLAASEEELPALDELERRARANGVPDVVRVDRAQIRSLEPHVHGVSGLHSPMTGIVDYGEVARAYADEVRQRGGTILLSAEVERIEAHDDGAHLFVRGRAIRTARIVTCAGLQSDRLAAMTGARTALRIVPFRGSYYQLRHASRSLVRGLVYPVPDARFPFLGVHLTPRMDGSVWAGPSAVVAFAREGYSFWKVSPSELMDTLTYRGFWRLAGRYWQTGLSEMRRDVSRTAYASVVRRYLPSLRGRDLIPAAAGVRAQAIALDGSLIDDFVIRRSGAAVHVLNAPSPAATSALAIADVVADRALAP